MPYERYTAIAGVYKHHQGSSSSTSSRTWIEEIRIAWGLTKNDHIDCAAAGCSNKWPNRKNLLFHGCHLAESRIKEALSLLGIGGTPVVAMCANCHDKNGEAILIGNVGIGIIDANCPADLRGPSVDIDWDKHIECSNCGQYDTRGPDEDGDWYCSTCEHHIDSSGDCITDNCCESDSDDEEWVPECNTCEDSSDVSDPGGDYYWCSHCEHDIDDDGDCVTDPCSTCDEGECPVCEGEGDLTTEDDEYDGQKIYICYECNIYYDEDSELWPSDWDGTCRVCHENNAADDCPKEQCGSCCDGNYCDRHG